MGLAKFAYLVRRGNCQDYAAATEVFITEMSLVRWSTANMGRAPISFFNKTHLLADPIASKSSLMLAVAWFKGREYGMCKIDTKQPSA
jgi:hypothetical protein